jgi:hypothetical protein
VKAITPSAVFVVVRTSGQPYPIPLPEEVIECDDVPAIEYLYYNADCYRDSHSINDYFVFIFFFLFFFFSFTFFSFLFLT